ncbi:MAG: hypothetical protein M3198_05815 [Actinomycetota bacterium]|nr:hypothetical protein [Actinomycetota bacterium]
MIGIGAAAAYVAVAVLPVGRGGIVVRPIFDGLAPPPPYRWLNPPPELADDNIPAEGGRGVVPLAPSGSEAQSITTGDGQASVIFPANAIPPRRGDSSALIEIAPRHPADLGPPPAGLRFDGQAYEVRGTFAPSGEPVKLGGQGRVQVVLRYPIHASTMLYWAGSAWQPLPTTPVSQSLQLVATIPDLGAFVASGPPTADADLPGVTPWWAYAAAGAGLLLLGLRTVGRVRRTEMAGVGTTEPREAGNGGADDKASGKTARRVRDHRRKK